MYNAADNFRDYAVGMATKRRIADVTEGLRWTQPRTMARHFGLCAGDEVLATLTFVSVFGSLAKGESGDGCWTFKPGGFIRTHVTERDCQAQDDLATFRNNTWAGGGALEIPDGRGSRQLQFLADAL